MGRKTEPAILKYVTANAVIEAFFVTNNGENITYYDFMTRSAYHFFERLLRAYQPYQLPIFKKEIEIPCLITHDEEEGVLKIESLEQKGLVLDIEHMIWEKMRKTQDDEFEKESFTEETTTEIVYSLKEIVHSLKGIKDVLEEIRIEIIGLS